MSFSSLLTLFLVLMLTSSSSRSICSLRTALCSILSSFCRINCMKVGSEWVSGVFPNISGGLKAAEFSIAICPIAVVTVSVDSDGEIPVSSILRSFADIS
uniref:(northern house mosquito) hypothetical protein n=1 Tax=Culex pipiens TaxID=7175 RepID=A0A8D8AE56_CULPI